MSTPFTSVNVPETIGWSPLALGLTRMLARLFGDADMLLESVIFFSDISAGLMEYAVHGLEAPDADLVAVSIDLIRHLYPIWPSTVSTIMITGLLAIGIDDGSETGQAFQSTAAGRALELLRLVGESQEKHGLAGEDGKVEMHSNMVLSALPVVLSRR